MMNLMLLRQNKEQADTIRKTLKTLKNERLKINSILDKMNEGSFY